MAQALLHSGCVAARVRGPPSLTSSSKVSSLPRSGLVVTTRRIARRHRHPPLAVSGRRGGSIIIASAVNEQQERHEQHEDIDDDGVSITQNAKNNIVPVLIPSRRLEVVEEEEPAKTSQKETGLKKKVRVQVIKNITLDVDHDATLHDVKAILEYKENIPAEDQKLYFAERELPDDLPVAHTSIPRKSALVMRLRGEALFLLFPRTGKKKKKSNSNSNFPIFQSQ